MPVIFPREVYPQIIADIIEVTAYKDCYKGIVSMLLVCLVVIYLTFSTPRQHYQYTVGKFVPVIRLDYTRFTIIHLTGLLDSEFLGRSLANIDRVSISYRRRGRVKTVLYK